MSSGPFVGNPGPVLVRECGIKVVARMRITCPIRREGKCRGQAWAPHTLRRAICIWKVLYTIEKSVFFQAKMLPRVIFTVTKRVLGQGVRVEGSHGFPVFIYGFPI